MFFRFFWGVVVVAFGLVCGLFFFLIKVTLFAFPLAKFLCCTDQCLRLSFKSQETVALSLCDLSVAGQLKAYPRLRGCSVMSNESPALCHIIFCKC